MIFPDVNILIYAYERRAREHESYRLWLQEQVDSERMFGLSEAVLSSFLRIVTHPKIFATPAPLEAALRFANDLREQPNCSLLSPGSRHWGIFSRLCRHINAKGNDIPDTYLAALAIETGSELITADRGFARFPELKWRHLN